MADAATATTTHALRCARTIGLALGVALALLACDESKPPLSGVCDAATACEAGVCVAGQCVDPALDQDGDGLTNGFEIALGSDPALADSDGDGIDDRAELGASLDLVDTDGDGRPDIVESATADADGDCITDQYDADDANPSDDPSPMIPAVCRLVGVCANPTGLAVDCSSGAAVCVYDGVAGYADPEIACDGRDENCDGAVDDGFSAAECQVTPRLEGGGGTYEIGSTRYRATLGFGPGPVGAGASSGHRVVLGTTPTIIPSPSEAP